jgi:T-complex protein 1 subunit beta
LNSPYFFAFYVFSLQEAHWQDMSKTQDDEVGDGTTSVTVLASELLKEAEKLIAAKIHPQTIISGWRKAVDCARTTLTEHARDHG